MKRKTYRKYPRVLKTKNRKIMILSRYAVSNSKISRLIKDQKASGFLSILGIRTCLSKIPELGDILF